MIENMLIETYELLTASDAFPVRVISYDSPDNTGDSSSAAAIQIHYGKDVDKYMREKNLPVPDIIPMMQKYGFLFAEIVEGQSISGLHVYRELGCEHYLCEKKPKQPRGKWITIIGINMKPEQLDEIVKPSLNQLNNKASSQTFCMSGWGAGNF